MLIVKIAYKPISRKMREELENLVSSVGIEEDSQYDDELNYECTQELFDVVENKFLTTQEIEIMKKDNVDFIKFHW